MKYLELFDLKAITNLSFLERITIVVIRVDVYKNLLLGYDKPLAQNIFFFFPSGSGLQFFIVIIYIRPVGSESLFVKENSNRWF